MSKKADNPGKPRGRGRPKAKVDPEVVSALAGVGCTVEEIADHFGVNKKTIERRFIDVIEKGRLRARRSLRRRQFEGAMNGDRTLLIWLGKVMLGQSDRVAVTGADGGPLKHHVAVQQMTNEQLDKEIEKLIGPLSGAASKAGDPDPGEE